MKAQKPNYVFYVYFNVAPLSPKQLWCVGVKESEPMGITFHDMQNMPVLDWWQFWK